MTCRCGIDVAGFLRLLTGFLPRPRRPRRIDVSMLGGLRDKIPPDHPPFDIHKIREEGYDPVLRD